MLADGQYDAYERQFQTTQIKSGKRSIQFERSK